MNKDEFRNFRNTLKKMELNENFGQMGGFGGGQPPMGQMGQPMRQGQPRRRPQMPMPQMGQPPMGQPPMGGFGGGQPPMGQPPMGGFGGGQPPMGQQQDPMKMPGMGGPSSQTVSAQDQFGALEEPEPSMFDGQQPMGQQPMGGFGGGQQPMMGRQQPPMPRMGQQPMGGFGGGQQPMGQQPPMPRMGQQPMGGFGGGQQPMGGFGGGQQPMGGFGGGQQPMGQQPMMGRKRRPQQPQMGGFGMYEESVKHNKKKI